MLYVCTAFTVLAIGASFPRYAPEKSVTIVIKGDVHDDFRIAYCHIVKQNYFFVFKKIRILFNFLIFVYHIRFFSPLIFQVFKIHLLYRAITNFAHCFLSD